jgi:hypothetical protein
MSAAQLYIPSNYEITEIMQQLLPTLRKDRGSPVNEFCPTTTVDVTTLIWEQQDNYTGMMSPRGLDGPPTIVSQVGLSNYVARPSYYGEEMILSEREIMDQRKWGTPNQPVDMTELTMRKANQLLHRQFVLEEYLTWQLILNGYYIQKHPVTGSIIAQDSWTQRSYTSSVDWYTFATATPLQDMRNIWLLHRGYSVAFNKNANNYMNRYTLNGAVQNRNANDIYGQRTGGFFTGNLEVTLNLASVNEVLTGEDLAPFSVYDEGYYDSTNTFQQWIPNEKSVVIGKRLDGSRILEYVYTSNMANMDMTAGPAYRTYMTPEAVPKPMIYRGFNGVHRMLFPSAIIACNF